MVGTLMNHAPRMARMTYPFQVSCQSTHWGSSQTQSSLLIYLRGALSCLLDSLEDR